MRKMITLLVLFICALGLFGCNQTELEDNKYKLEVVDNWNLLVHPLEKEYEAGSTIEVHLAFRSGPSVGIKINGEILIAKEFSTTCDQLCEFVSFTMPNEDTVIYTHQNGYIAKSCGDDNHTWDEGDLTQVPGGGEVMLYTCLVCGERRTEDIHNDIGYACHVTIAGEIDSLIENVSGTYTAGTTLEIYSHPLMDVDLAMYVNGEFHQIQDTIKVDGEYRWRYSLVLPAEDIVIEFKIVDIEYSDVKTILNIPNLTLDDIVEVRYEHGYIGVAPGSLTNISYSTDMEDRNSLLSLLEMTVYEENGNKWEVSGGFYVQYSIFANNERYDVEISNNYISVNQKHYRFVGEYVSFEYPHLEAHGFVSYQETAEVWWNETFICEIPMNDLEFKRVDSYVSTEGGIVGDWVLKTEFGNLYFPEPKIFENSNNYELTGLSLFKLVEKYSNWWISPNGQPVQIEE